MVIQPGINPCSGKLGGCLSTDHCCRASTTRPGAAGKLTPALLCWRHTEIQSPVVMERWCWAVKHQTVKHPRLLTAICCLLWQRTTGLRYFTHLLAELVTESRWRAVGVEMTPRCATIGKGKEIKRFKNTGVMWQQEHLGAVKLSMISVMKQICYQIYCRSWR